MGGLPDDLEKIITTFNKIELDEKFALDKAAPLVEFLSKLGLPSMKVYDAETARKCRLANLNIPNRFYGYPKSILDTPGFITEKLRCE